MTGNAVLIELLPRHPSSIGCKPRMSSGLWNTAAPLFGARICRKSRLTSEDRRWKSRFPKHLPALYNLIFPDITIRIQPVQGWHLLGQSRTYPVIQPIKLLFLRTLPLIKPAAAPAVFFYLIQGRISLFIEVIGKSAFGIRPSYA